MILIDTTNLFRSIKKKFGFDKKLNYDKYIKVIQEKYGEHNIIAYISKQEESKRFVEYLEFLGVKCRQKRPFIKETESSKSSFIDFCVELTLDAIQSKDDTIIIGSSDSRLLPLIKHLSDKKVVIYAVNIPKIFNSVATEIMEIEEELMNENDTAVTKT